MTEDKRLIGYDNYLTGKKRSGLNIPVFFSPSILLKKLIKYSPVQSVDYRRAFISTISSPALEGNSNTSRVAIRSVAYFHNMGISDEKMILDCIKDEIFIQRFKELEATPNELKEFVESDLQVKYQQLNTEVSEAKSQLEQHKEIVTELGSKNMEQSSENDRLTTHLADLSQAVKLYEKAIGDLRKDKQPKQAVISNQLTLAQEKDAVDTETERKDLLKLKESLEPQIYQIRRFKYHRWKRRSLWCLIPIFFLTICVVLSFFFQDSDWNIIARLINAIDTLGEFRRSIAEWIMGILFSIGATFPANFIRQRYNRQFDPGEWDIE